MINKQYQTQLLEQQPLVVDLPDADIHYDEKFLDVDLAWQFYERLIAGVNWRQETIIIYGKEHPVPRLWCWMADSGLDYAYSNKTMTPEPWSKNVLSIKSKLETITKLSFNSVLINYYRDGQDSNGWHADDEPELGTNPVIASLSLGATRDFQLKHKQDNHLKYSIPLAHGSLLLMQGTTQAYWKHQIPKRAHAEPRINLTFRTIKNPAK
ncbi:MAG: alpha-ketoglutarate-dependent dioxygenase AlkB [Acidiferrobacterales bacterium]|nr:alpha-ketoglutarate-dependent dioxygenase AlkB [Acidiferrobacterales bacterium]